MSDVSVTRLPTLGMIALRGDLGTLGKAVKPISGCDLPDQRMITTSDGCTLMWMSPDELLLICEYDHVGDLVDALVTRLGDEFATVCDISDARQVFDLQGGGALAVLSHLMPVDFAKLQRSELRRTRMAQIPAALWQQGEGWRVMCFRSVADYAEGLLRHEVPVGG